MGTCVVAQKQLTKTVLEPSITLVHIDASNCFEVHLETGNTEHIQVEAQLEGEYSKDLNLEVYEKGSTLMIGAGFKSSFVNPNDKLSAHKVISIALRVRLPKWKNVQIFGTNSRIIATGDYSNLKIILADGSCELRQVSQNTNVKTHSGNILLEAKSGKIDAYSKYGTINKKTIPNGDDQYSLSSVTGNIQLNKTE